MKYIIVSGLKVGATFFFYNQTTSFLTYELIRNKRLLSKDILRWHFIFSDGKPTPDPLYLRNSILRLLIREKTPIICDLAF